MEGNDAKSQSCKIYRDGPFISQENVTAINQNSRRVRFAKIVNSGWLDEDDVYYSSDESMDSQVFLCKMIQWGPKKACTFLFLHINE
jgi:hypothetical protein